MSEGWNIAILGATGAVGEALLETLAERQFPVGEIYALARTDSAGEHLRFGGKSVMVQDAAAFDWTQAQLAFFAAGAEATASYIEEATSSGCLVIDLSGLFSPRSRMCRWWCRTSTRLCWLTTATATSLQYRTASPASC